MLVTFVIAMAGVSGAASADLRGSEDTPANGGSIQCRPSGSTWVCFECHEIESLTLCAPKLVVGLPPPNPNLP